MKAPHRAPPVPAPSLPLRHPAWLAALFVAAACVVVSVSFRLYDTDLWQLLVGGKAMWVQHRIPQVDLWTWRRWGAPEMLSSWAFRALLWPIWSAAGLWGLYLWRWITVLAAFALLWAAARRMGARGFVALAAVVWWAVLFRARSHVRPETLAAVLFALTLWILETRRRGGPDRSLWLIPIACAWANVHATYYLGFLLQALYLLDAALTRRAREEAAAPVPAARWRRPWVVLLACGAASFLNPFGWSALAQPVEFALRWRADPMFLAVAELRPLPLDFYLVNPHLFAPWLLLLAWWAWKRGPDWVEIVGFVLFAALARSSARFIGLYALVAAPFFARDLQALVESLRWPAWTRRSTARAGLAAAACLVAGLPEWMRADPPLGVGFSPVAFPERACDFLEAHEVRGRGFNDFQLGGYLAYRFWPDRSRLPFFTTQPELADPGDRALYARALVDPGGWRALDSRYRFDYAVLDREQQPGRRLHDSLDQDTSWALVFADDAAEVYLRRQGPMATRAESLAFGVLPGGREGREKLINACATDTALRARAKRDLQRQIASSPRHANAEMLLGVLTLMDGRLPQGQRLLEAALSQLPSLANAHWFLGLAALRENRPRRAIPHLEAERRLHGWRPGLDLRLGQAYQQMGNSRRARAAYQSELARDPANAAARAALARLRGAGAGP